MPRLPVLAALAALLLPVAIAAKPSSHPTATASAPADPAAREAQARIDRIQAQLHPVSGDIAIPGANAVLHLGQAYYFLPASEARLILTEGWGNPSSAADGVLGIVFPAGRNFSDPDAWGAVITYEASGYVSDVDAAQTDYADLLQQMRQASEDENVSRQQQGFPAVHLVGWAQAPAYDPNAHSLVWARNIRFDGVPDNSLNYDVRLLGRRGVLSLSMISVMPKLAETRTAAQSFAATAAFNPGSRYADYQAGTDPVAEYGITGLIAAGAGLAIAKKAGLLALILAFGKKAIIFIVAGLAFLRKRIARLFGRGRDEDVAPYQAAPSAAELAASLPSTPEPPPATES